jgi:hypothetical protein
MRYVGKATTGLFLLLGTTAMAQDSAWPNMENNKNVGAEVNQPKAGAAAVDRAAISPAAKDLRFYMGKATNEAIGSSRPITRLVDLLVRSDRERIEPQVQKEYPELKKTVADFRQAWKDKYKEDFDLSRSMMEVAFADSRCLQGELSDQAIMASQRLGPAPTEQARGQFEDMRDKTSDIAPKSAEAIKPAANAEKSATVLLPGMREQQLTPVTLRFNDEGTILSDWRLNVPATLTAQKLHDNLQAHLTAILADKANWPAEPRDAYHIVSHHVMASLADQPYRPITPKATDMRERNLDVED